MNRTSSVVSDFLASNKVAWSVIVASLPPVDSADIIVDDLWGKKSNLGSTARVDVNSRPAVIETPLDLIKTISDMRFLARPMPGRGNSWIGTPADH